MSIALSVFKNKIELSRLISFSLDKKLILLVMVVSIFALSITSFLSFNYAEEILKQRVGNQLISESTIRGNSIENFRSFFLHKICGQRTGFGGGIGDCS